VGRAQSSAHPPFAREEEHARSRRLDSMSSVRLAVFATRLTIRLIVLVFAFQGASPAVALLLALGRDVLLAAVIIPAGITVLFAAREYLDFRFRYSERWKPEAIPLLAAGHLPSRERRPADRRSEVGSQSG
jgi:hypothetical protein